MASTSEPADLADVGGGRGDVENKMDEMQLDQSGGKKRRKVMQVLSTIGGIAFAAAS